MAKIKWKQNENQSLPTSQQNSINFGGMITTWIAIVLTAYGIGSVVAMNKTLPLELNEFPGKILVLNHQIFTPGVVNLTMFAMFYGKNKRFRQAVKRIIFPEKIHPVYD